MLQLSPALFDSELLLTTFHFHQNSLFTFYTPTQAVCNCGCATANSTRLLALHLRRWPSAARCASWRGAGSAGTWGPCCTEDIRWRQRASATNQLMLGRSGATCCAVAHLFAGCAAFLCNCCYGCTSLSALATSTLLYFYCCGGGGGGLSSLHPPWLKFLLHIFTPLTPWWMCSAAYGAS